MCDGHSHDPVAFESPAGRGRGLKIAVSGKGGVGKTTLAAMLARSFAAEGRRVLAIDADPDANLASALGVPAAQRALMRPLAHQHALARERTGAEEGFGSMFRLNPRVDDLPEAHWVEHQGVRILAMGTVEQAGGGCVCPEHALVKSLVKHLLLERDDVVILDMEAGIEHLGRGTAAAVDALVVVVEPGQRSFQTARQISALAAGLGIRNVLVVGSKVRDEGDRRLVAQALPELRLLGFLSESDAIRQSDAEGTAAFDASPEARAEAIALRDRLATEVARPTSCACLSPGPAKRPHGEWTVR